MIILRRNIFKIGIVYYDDVQNNSDEVVDVIEYYHQSKVEKDCHFKKLYTLTIDLGADENAIFDKIKKNTRYEITRAIQRDNLKSTYWFEDSINKIDEFLLYYNDFAGSKGLPLLKSNRLQEYAMNNRLDISCVTSFSGEPFCWHVYYRTDDEVRLLFSVSLTFRQQTSDIKQIIGRANRALHWYDIKRFKNSHIKLYDFGGWYEGTSDQQKIGINKFKEEFGGIIREYYDYSVARSLKGKLYVSLKKIYNIGISK